MKIIHALLLIFIFLTTVLGSGFFGKTQELRLLRAENDGLKKQIAALEDIQIETSRQRDEAMRMMNKLTKSLKELIDRVNSMPEFKNATGAFLFPPLPPLPEVSP